MKKMRIAITGGIGSGKSFVLDAIKQMGYETFSCDEIYREICDEKNYVRRLEEEFGKVSLNGKLDKAALAKIVFSDEEKLKKLNEIAHPIIMKNLSERMDKIKDVCFVEVPLLFEGGYEDLFDKIIVVTRDKKERIAAVLERDNTDENSVLKRMEKQFDYDKLNSQKSSPKIVILENKGSVGEFITKIKLLVKQVL